MWSLKKGIDKSKVTSDIQYRVIFALSRYTSLCLPGLRLKKVTEKQDIGLLKISWWGTSTYFTCVFTVNFEQLFDKVISKFGRNTSRNHFKLRNSNEHLLVIIELVMDRKGRFDLTDAEQAFKREGCTTSACHASVRVEYWQEWVKEFEIVFVNSFF